MNRVALKWQAGIIAMLGFFFWSCDRSPSLVQVNENGFTQGTTYTISYYTERPDPSIMRGIDSLFSLMNRTASLYDSLSVISRFNRNIPCNQNPHFRILVAASLKISEKTRGAFDITVGPLVQAWGFRKRDGILVTDSVVKELLHHTGYQKISILGDSVIKLDPLVQIDLNAIAQGYTVDLVAYYLQAQGITRYLVEIGGEIRAGDAKPGDHPWIVGIEKPAASDTSPQLIQERIALKHHCVVTSGNYRNYFTHDGKTYSHTIDPRTGYPVSDALISVTVTGENCMEADAWATALMTMGLREAMASVDEEPGLEALMISRDDTGHVVTNISSGFPPFLGKL